MKQTEETKALAQRMVEMLKTMPDNTEISTFDMLEKMGIVCETPSEDSFNLDYLFLETAKRNGFLVDTAKYEGLCVGFPIYIASIFRNKKNLMAKFAEQEEKEVLHDDGRYYVRQFIESRTYEEEDEEPITETQTLQLFRITPGHSTGMIDCTNHRLVAITLRGKGTFEFVDDRDDYFHKERLYYRKQVFCTECSCSFKNDGDSDLILYVVDIDESCMYNK